MTDHPDATMFDSFVMGTLGDDADFVAHVSTCARCGETLRREARLELALFEVGDARRAPRRRAERAAPVVPLRKLAVGATVVALAAGVALLVRRAPVAREASIGADAALAPAGPLPSSDPAPPELGPPVPLAAVPDADRTIASLRPAFRRCYEETIAGGEELNGKVLLSVHVAADGAVAMVDSVTTEGLPRTAAACIAETMHNARFKAPSRPTMFSFPVSFSRQ